MFEDQKKRMAAAVLNALGMILSARFNSRYNQTGPGVRSYKITGKDYSNRVYKPYELANPEMIFGERVTRQQVRRINYCVAKEAAVVVRLQRRNDRRKAVGLPKIKSLATCKKNAA